MKKTNHPNIMKLNEVIDNSKQKKLYMVVEYLPRGPCYIDGQPPLSEETARKYMRQILLGIDYLHTYNIVHHDIKPDNILLDHEGNCKICDFGVSLLYPDANYRIKEIRGTPAYIPPEAIQVPPLQEGYVAAKHDIWSLGVLLFHFLFGHPPFVRKTIAETYKAIREERIECIEDNEMVENASHISSNNLPDRPISSENEEEAMPGRMLSDSFDKKLKMIVAQDKERACNLSKEVKDLLRRLLEKNPDKRIAIKEIMDHDWITQHGTFPLCQPESLQEKITVSEKEISSSVTPLLSFRQMVSIQMKMKKQLRDIRAKLMGGSAKDSQNNEKPKQNERAVSAVNFNTHKREQEKSEVKLLSNSTSFRHLDSVSHETRDFINKQIGATEGKDHTHTDIEPNPADFVESGSASHDTDTKQKAIQSTNQTVTSTLPSTKSSNSNTAMNTLTLQTSSSSNSAFFTSSTSSNDTTTHNPFSTFTSNTTLNSTLTDASYAESTPMATLSTTATNMQDISSEESAFSTLKTTTSSEQTETLLEQNNDAETEFHPRSVSAPQIPALETIASNSNNIININYSSDSNHPAAQAPHLTRLPTCPQYGSIQHFFQPNSFKPLLSPKTKARSPMETLSFGNQTSSYRSEEEMPLSSIDTFDDDSSLCFESEGNSHSIPISPDTNYTHGKGWFDDGIDWDADFGRQEDESKSVWKRGGRGVRKSVENEEKQNTEQKEERNGAYSERTNTKEINAEFSNGQDVSKKAKLPADGETYKAVSSVVPINGDSIKNNNLLNLSDTISSSGVNFSELSNTPFPKSTASFPIQSEDNPNLKPPLLKLLSSSSFCIPELSPRTPASQNSVSNGDAPQTNGTTEASNNFVVSFQQPIPCTSQTLPFIPQKMDLHNHLPKAECAMTDENTNKSAVASNSSYKIANNYASHQTDTIILSTHLHSNPSLHHRPTLKTLSSVVAATITTLIPVNSKRKNQTTSHFPFHSQHSNTSSHKNAFQLPSVFEEADSSSSFDRICSTAPVTEREYEGDGWMTGREKSLASRFAKQEQPSPFSTCTSAKPSSCKFSSPLALKSLPLNGMKCEANDSFWMDSALTERKRGMLITPRKIVHSTRREVGKIVEVKRRIDEELSYKGYSKNGNDNEVMNVFHHLNTFESQTIVDDARNWREMHSEDEDKVNHQDEEDTKFIDISKTASGIETSSKHNLSLQNEDQRNQIPSSRNFEKKLFPSQLSSSNRIDLTSDDALENSAITERTLQSTLEKHKYSAFSSSSPQHSPQNKLSTRLCRNKTFSVGTINIRAVHHPSSEQPQTTQFSQTKESNDQTSNETEAGSPKKTKDISGSNVIRYHRKEKDCFSAELGINKTLTDLNSSIGSDDDLFIIPFDLQNQKLHSNNSGTKQVHTSPIRSRWHSGTSSSSRSFTEANHENASSADRKNAMEQVHELQERPSTTLQENIKTEHKQQNEVLIDPKLSPPAVPRMSHFTAPSLLKVQSVMFNDTFSSKTQPQNARNRKDNPTSAVVENDSSVLHTPRHLPSKQSAGSLKRKTGLITKANIISILTSDYNSSSPLEYKSKPFFARNNATSHSYRIQHTDSSFPKNDISRSNIRPATVEPSVVTTVFNHLPSPIPSIAENIKEGKPSFASPDMFVVSLCDQVPERKELSPQRKLNKPLLSEQRRVISARPLISSSEASISSSSSSSYHSYSPRGASSATLRYQKTPSDSSPHSSRNSSDQVHASQLDSKSPLHSHFAQLYSSKN
eukprot:MONOS_11422.1-p1 / transcript=MONOS_11422.1 / gene=MONOS_11422 / organism=Monocercomonoides_exilis_PA203 / gene_product=calcium / transcript_product=calcium / location=Mono_scaffold00572:32081-37833(+) / protein_length=1750 / sequence_SO=supercontig / SO=protein_coding / is_pseudo=false